MITMADINTIVNQGLMLVIKMSLPVLLTSMIVGLIISIFQTVTSIQEQTLTFVPKAITIVVLLLVLGSFNLESMKSFLDYARNILFFRLIYFFLLYI